MPVIQTQNWLYQFVELCEKQSGKGASLIQREVISDPIMKLFPHINSQACQYELLRHGLFDPNEWLTLKDKVKEMETQNVWQVVKEEYKMLRRLWDGPKVPIYIFPIKKVSSKFGEQIPNKNGVAYRKALFLFLSTELAREEIKALLAHEYNHVCRLSYLDLSPEKISLKDSLIIEGLGEYAVKDLYGEKWLGPWSNLYSLRDAIELWKEHFIPSLDVKGVKNHHHFLFGKDRSPLPKWIGYYIGYQIVNTFQKNRGPFRHNELYSKSSKEIIAGSDFPINK
ncbi:DUF2268 domain-containing putative Zn-dependent protease [Psychrobacillus sp. FSL H8-0483]|uniref:DUF2268 domain-containing protein n=1 Tax=Psychrobacillus sp. FSL H8-0483 TaxID=2921389 RepID=UPI00315B2B16